MQRKPFKISICITIMNRLHQLQRTLPENIRSNSDYETLEYVILDYNSSDGLAHWIYANFKDELVAGVVLYYKVETANKFNPSHAKNLAFEIAGGEIVCNVNADHYTGKSFVRK